jgi:hypothetical protein
LEGVAIQKSQPCSGFDVFPILVKACFSGNFSTPLKSTANYGTILANCPRIGWKYFIVSAR